MKEHLLGKKHRKKETIQQLELARQDAAERRQKAMEECNKRHIRYMLEMNQSASASTGGSNNNGVKNKVQKILRNTPPISPFVAPVKDKDVDMLKKAKKHKLHAEYLHRQSNTDFNAARFFQNAVFDAITRDYSLHGFAQQRSIAGYRASQHALKVVDKAVWDGKIHQDDRDLASFRRLDGIFVAAMKEYDEGGHRREVVTFAALRRNNPRDDYSLGQVDYTYDDAKWTGTWGLNDRKLNGQWFREFKISLANDHFLYLPPQLVGMDAKPRKTKHHGSGLWYRPTFKELKKQLPFVCAFVLTFFSGTQMTPFLDLSVNAQRLDMEFQHRGAGIILTIQFEPGMPKPLDDSDEETIDCP